MNRLARQLLNLNACALLVAAAYEHHIAVLECAMPKCLCPKGRKYFERRGDPHYNPWAPSADRWPVPGRDGGEYVIENVRLAHLKCNVSAGGRAGGLAQTNYARSPEGRAVRSRNGRAHSRGWKNPAVGRKNQSIDGRRASVVGGQVAACLRWNIQRDKPCACGKHVPSAGVEPATPPS